MKLIAFIVLSVFSYVALAVDVQKMSSPQLQQTYESINTELRCLVCQNQTIADSNADLAADLRRQVAEMLEQGKSKQNIIDFMTARYGDFVLYKPSFYGKTALLWWAPALFLLLGIVAVFIVVRQKKRTQVDRVVNTEQQQKASRLLDEGDGA